MSAGDVQKPGRVRFAGWSVVGCFAASCAAITWFAGNHIGALPTLADSGQYQPLPGDVVVVTLTGTGPTTPPGHQMRGVRAESMLLGLVNAGLASGLSHVGYLGLELAKAEIALRLGLDYEQDLPVTPRRAKCLYLAAALISLGSGADHRQAQVAE